MSARTKEDNEERNLRSSNETSSVESTDNGLLPRLEVELPVPADYLPGILNGTLPPADEKYLDNSGSYYTSSFQARPQAEYFDFDDAYKYKPENDSYNQLVGDDAVETELQEPEKQQDVDTLEIASSANLEAMINMCKSAFNDMINEIDGVLLTEPKYRFSAHAHKTSFSTNENLWQIIELVNENLENSKLTRKLTPPFKFQKNQESTVNDDPCAVLPNFGVVLIKSPTSISQLWDEYTKKPSEWPITDLLSFILQQQGSQQVDLVVKRRTSIQQLEAQLGSSWRNFDKNFSRQINRRKKIWRAIEEGLTDGLSLQECFHILETYVKERGSGLSWYYNGVPFKLVEHKDSA